MGIEDDVENEVERRVKLRLDLHRLRVIDSTIRQLHSLTDEEAERLLEVIYTIDQRTKRILRDEQWMQ